MLQEFDDSYDTTAQYTDYPGMWGGLVSKRAGSTSSYYGFDQSDDTRELIDASGAVNATMTYEPFGERIDGTSDDTFATTDGDLVLNIIDS